MIDDQISGVLQPFRDDDVVIIPNPGNAGDSFITCATYQMLDDLGIRYRVGSPLATYPGAVVVYAGGGNLIGAYTNAIDFIQRNHRLVKALIVLPHTIDAFDDVLATLGANCTIFCREQRSFDHVSSCVTQARVFMAHDMALGADLQRIRANVKALNATSMGIPRFNREDVRLTLIAYRHMVRSGGRFEILSAFRTDVEKTDVDIPPHNFDVSAIFATRDLSPEACARTTVRMMAFLDRYACIRTNRLHVCILSLMLGKRVEFYPNSYYKNEAIYEHSLRSRFPLLIWKGRAKEAGTDGGNTRGLPDWLSPHDA